MKISGSQQAKLKAEFLGLGTAKHLLKSSDCHVPRMRSHCLGRESLPCLWCQIPLHHAPSSITPIIPVEAGHSPCFLFPLLCVRVGLCVCVCVRVKAHACVYDSFTSSAFFIFYLQYFFLCRVQVCMCVCGGVLT